MERTNALETANKKLKEAERSAKVFMQRANAKISEALRENDFADQGPSPSSSSSKVERYDAVELVSAREDITHREATTDGRRRKDYLIRTVIVILKRRRRTIKKRVRRVCRRE